MEKMSVREALQQVLRRWPVFAILLSSTLAVAVIDSRVGPGHSFASLYYLPIVLAALYFGYAGGIAFATLASVLYYGTILSRLGTLTPDVLLPLSFFFVFGLAFGKVAWDRQTMTQLAITDQLTGLFNRRYFYQRLDQEMDRAHRHARVFSVLMMDLDYFKRVNDRFGHSLGDKVLVEVASVMRQVLRKTDVVARFGGEEFVALLPESDCDGAFAAAERLRKALPERTAELFQAVGPVTLSIGVTQFSDAHKTVDNLVEEADRALYAAKESGRDTVSRFDQLTLSL